MKIRKRIAYTFTSLFGVLLISLCIIIYYLSSETLQQLFHNRLDERLRISEQFFLEKDKFSPSVRETVQQNFLKTLPQEIEYADTLTNFLLPKTLEDKVPKDFVQLIRENKNELSWEQSNFQGVARVYLIDNTEYIVLVAAVDEYGSAYLKKLRNLLLISVLLSLFIIYILSNFFSKKVLKPISGKINKANKISASNLDLRLTVYNENDELGMLALSFNNLLDRLQKSFELEKNFVRYASHELKNPLTVILGEAEVALLKNRSTNEYVNTIEKIKTRAEKLNQLLDHFLQLSTFDSSKLNLKETNIDNILMDVTFNLSQLYPHIDIQFDIEINGESEDYAVQADEQLLYNAFYNLIENACKFSKPNSTVWIELSKNKKQLIVSIRDTGIGIEDDQLENIFESLYRGNNTHGIEGNGIGLSLVKRIIDLHGGKIIVKSEIGLGSEFIIHI
jgi:signal transduction histidine kinase